jgi:phage gp36-like protein
VTTPAATLYASIDDLRLVLDSTDAGQGTAAQLSDEQLTLALEAATDRVALYAGTEFTDPVPGIIHDLTLDLGSWWATTYYLKQKEMGPNHPVVLRYTEAMKILEASRKGEISLTGAGADGVGGAPSAASANVINRIPNIFTGADSNTRVVGDQLIDDVPSDMVGRRMIIPEQWGWG